MIKKHEAKNVFENPREVSHIQSNIKKTRRSNVQEKNIHRFYFA